MKASLLYHFLSDKISLNLFKTEISDEISNFRITLRNYKKAGSIPILIEDDLAFIFEITYLQKLCNHYLAKELDEVELEYISDCVILRVPDYYENDELIDFLESLTDSKVNGKVNKDRIIRIKNQLLTNQNL